jgi:predicted dehydrogenase
MSDTKKPEPVDRRGFFLQTSAAAGAALALTAQSFGNVLGSNERIGIGFIGAGGRGQAHLDIINQMKRDGKAVSPVAICDVWDGIEDEYEQEFGGRKTRRRYLRGLFPSAKKAGLNPDDRKRVVKDYRRLLELRDVDVVCISTPDHWHARMSIDAAMAGKDIYCEKPMTRTPEEALLVCDAMLRYQRVMTVGVQSLADPTWSTAHELIRRGRIGHVCQVQTSLNRNDIRGQWRYYRLVEDMTPNTIDWDLFLGHKFEVVPGIPLAERMDFDRAAYAQWRCYWPFSGGPFTDMLVHQATRLMAAVGVRFPSRVVGGGGIFLEYDGREVPDVASIIADYEEGCQFLLSSTMISHYPSEEVIRGRLGTIRFVKGGFHIISDDPSRSSGIPQRLEETIKPAESITLDQPRNDTSAMWEQFLDCVRRRDAKTLCPPDLGAAAIGLVGMGIQSYRESSVLFFDKEQRRIVRGDGSWASRWEKRSQSRAKPNHPLGWIGDDSSSTLQPPPDQCLAGPWVGGDDPASCSYTSRREN